MALPAKNTTLSLELPAEYGFQDFNERAKEVSQYFMLLKTLEQETTKLVMVSQSGTQKIKPMNSELIKTLKASGFLLLYNLVESTMRNAIKTIFDELQSNGISYDQIRPELKKVILKNLRKRNADELFLSITTISVDIITASFDKEDLFSGNIDSKKIKEAANDYGFSYLTDYGKTANGSDLLTIKLNRNDLAHGFKSFSEVGKDKTADELLEIRRKTINYLRQILQNIKQYLVNEEYLDQSR